MEKYVIDLNFNLVKMGDSNHPFWVCYEGTPFLISYQNSQISDIDLLNKISVYLTFGRKEILFNIIKFTDFKIIIKNRKTKEIYDIFLIFTFKSYTDEILYFLGS
jgi:hypothetical protein